MGLSGSKGHPSALRAHLFTVVFIEPCHCRILCSGPDPGETQTVTLLLPWSCGARSGRCGGRSRWSPGPDLLQCSLRWGYGGPRRQVPRCFQHGTLQWEVSCSLPRGSHGQCWSAAAFCSANLRAGYVPGIVVVVIVFEYRIGRLFRTQVCVKAFHQGAHPLRGAVGHPASELRLTGEAVHRAGAPSGSESGPSS